ncbi:uncharacterized protein LOC106646391, partial [Copidosoma floridanum]|uniref:uncharacterized protein LOC106646391 n=1 Tax=Copidosoma floridanum TaxID=29053 RepID=UPI000C6FC2D9
KKLLVFPGEDTEEVDSSAWSTKPVEEWCQEDTINWLMMASSCLGQNYSSIQQALALPGKDLVTLSRHDFVARDPVYGDRLYNMLHSQAIAATNSQYFGQREDRQEHHHHHHHLHHFGNDDSMTENFRNVCPEDEPQNVGSNSVSGEYRVLFVFN